MTRFVLIACGIASVLFLHGCSKILEPISLFGVKQGVETEGVQEYFEINIKSLTFESARKANNAAYPRLLMLSGSGSSAKVANEVDLLTNKIPPASPRPDYFLGLGDELSFTQINEFMPEITYWPTDLLAAEYLVGVGDELTLIQLNEGEIIVSSVIINEGDDEPSKSDTTSTERDSVIQSSGVVGTNGNILLLGLGSIKAANRTLNDIQTEVRNILIRNGLAPSFQLEISKFKSKKAFVIGKAGSEGNILSITNLPLTLREVGVNYGLKPSSDNTTIITLMRNSQRFRMTVGQLFDLQTPDIFIQDKDQIEIDETLELDVETVIARVGSQGKILLPGVGSIQAANRTLADLHNEIYKTLTERGFIPQFQLELTKFESKKAYLISKGLSSKVVPLTNSGMRLKELILSNGINIDNSKSLSLVKLLRNGKVFRMAAEDIFAPSAPDVWIQDGDQIEITNLNYKQGQVFALSGAGNAKIVTIDPSKRETLADILFVSGGALSNVLAKRSEVYLLRGRSPSVAYHLDAQNVSRILVAAQTELRPNDIVYVADRPIISFSRTLAEILPLRVLLRDLEDGNIP